MCRSLSFDRTINRTLEEARPIKRIQLNCFPEGRYKALTMSYDDGRIQDRRLVALFNQYGIKGTFHLNSGLFGLPNYIEADEVRALYEGHEIAVHTVSHPFLEQSPKEQVVMEILKDREALESIVGYPVRGMSYPYGTSNEDVVSYLPTLGIQYSRTTVSTGQLDMPHQPLLWNPTCHHKQMLELGRQFATLDVMPWHRKLTLLYVWGHSYEFDDNENWGEIEQFCNMMAKQPDIWFATNMELIEYKEALKRLQFTLDGTAVHNPSAISVWISVDQQPMKLEPGVLTRISG